MKKCKLIQFRKDCIGCHACVLYAPQNWQMNNKEGKSDLIGGIAKGDTVVTDLLEIDYYDNLKAAEACPMNIIKVVCSD